MAWRCGRKDQVCAQSVQVVEVLGASKDRFFEINLVSSSLTENGSSDLRSVPGVIPVRRLGASYFQVSPGTPPVRARASSRASAEASSGGSHEYG